MKKWYILLFVILLMTQLAAAEELLITTKTNEKITARYDLTNREDDTLQNCVAYFEGELRDPTWVSVTPVKFDLQPGDGVTIDVVIDRPPEGFYQDILSISCDRFFEGDFLGRGGVIAPEDIPTFTILVSEAGAGQEYFIKPADNTWRFVAKPRETKQVTLQIANVGNVPIPVDFTNSFVNSGTLIVEPQKFTIPIQGVKQVTLAYTAPDRFEEVNQTFTFTVGDYTEKFTIAATQSFTFNIGTFSLAGSLDLGGGIRIPNWIMIVVLVGLVYYYVFVMEKDSKWVKNLKKRLNIK